MTRADYDGLDVLEHVYRDLLPPDDEDQEEPLELDERDGIVSYALLLEMQRPPWWRENEAERRAQRREVAA